MVTPTGQIKLIDFGIVRFFKPGKTKDTQAIGTLGYCAPEATSGQTDARSDVYSLCVTLHQLLTLHDPATTIYNIPPVRKLNPGVSAELERVLIKGCQNQREQRWASATDLRMQLVQISTGGRQPPVYVTPAGSMVSASKPQVAAASPVAPTKIGPAYATPAPGTHGLTQRLAMMAVQLSGRQFAAILVGLVFLLVIPTVLLAPVFEDWGAEFNRIPIYTMFGILGYSALPKRGVAFLSQSLLTLALTLPIKIVLDVENYTYLELFLAVLAIGLVAEIWLMLLPVVRGKVGGASWVREAIWISLLGLMVMAVFYGILYDLDTVLDPLKWVLAVVFALVGWFIGDFISQFLLYRKIGLPHRP